MDNQEDHMKIAEALQLRKDLQIRISNLGTRLTQNATVQDGDSPSEDPKFLLKELDRDTKELEELIGKINIANATNEVDGKSITELIAKREILSQKINILRNLRYAASDLTDRAYGTDIKVVSTVSVPKIQKEIDDLSKELREVELKIQETNWLTEI